MVAENLGVGPIKSRFEMFDRVVCRIGGERGWGAGTIQALDQDDPTDPTETLPYVVKLDAPISKLISVPYDAPSVCRAEVCFGDISFTLRCKPQRIETSLRFEVGDRVAYAAADTGGDNSRSQSRASSSSSSDEVFQFGAKTSSQQHAPRSQRHDPPPSAQPHQLQQSQQQRMRRRHERRRQLPQRRRRPILRRPSFRGAPPPTR